MNVVLFDKPMTKKELMYETLCSCSHILELDVVREDLINYKKIENVIYPFQYSIKESNSNISSKEKRIFSNIDHLLFLQYPEYMSKSNTVNIKLISEKKSTSLEYKKLLCKFIDKIDIPVLFENDFLSNLEYNSSIEINLSIITKNLSIIQKSYLNNSKKWAIYVYLYKDIITELLKFKFNVEEIKNMNNILNNINTLLSIVQSEIINIEHSLQKKSMYQIQKENHQYAELLENINYIEIQLKPCDNSEWIYDICSGFKVSQIGDDFQIFSEYPDKLLSLYSKILSLNKNNFISLKMDEINTTQSNKAITHKIETNSNIWAYVYYKMFGENIEYSQKNDLEVTKILETAKKLNLPIEYLI